MEDGVLQTNNFCVKCNNNIFDFNNGSGTCINCGFEIIEKIKIPQSSNERNRNKIIHLNNVLKNMETIDVSLVTDLYNKLLNKIEKEQINPEFIDSTYISEFLKKQGKKNYILTIWLYNRFKGIEFKLSQTEKSSIKLIFNEFVDYISVQNSLHNKRSEGSISYQVILYEIHKYLKYKINLKPSITKNKNEEQIILFENFLNEICENHYNVKKKESEIKNKEIDCIPMFHDYPNIDFDNNMFL